MLTTKERIAKGPQWVRDEIDRLEGNARYWEAKATAGERESDTYIEHGFPTVEQNLPTGSRVNFKTEGGSIEVYVTGDGDVRVRADGGLLAFRPSAANSGSLQVVHR